MRISEVASLVVVMVLAVSGAGRGQDAPPVLPAQIPYAALTASQHAMVEAGGNVQLLEALTVSPWPRSTVFEFVDATPEECAAVVFDYELEATYIPRLKTSRIVRRSSPVQMDVQYVIDVPVFPDEVSVSREQLSVASGTYMIRWETLVSDSFPHKSVAAGRVLFSPMTNPRSGAQGTLMVHDQAVIPNTIFARLPFIRNKAIAVSRDAAHAIVVQVEGERKNNRRLLERQLAKLRQALAVQADSVHLEE